MLPHASSARHQTLASYNLGADTLTMRWPLQAFIDHSDIANREASDDPDAVAQRPLDRRHGASLALYILKGILNAARRIAASEGQSIDAFDSILRRLGDQTYYSLQPIVVNIPAKLEQLNPVEETNGSGDPLTLRVTLPPNATMWVIDGQHRRYALGLVLDFVRHVMTYRTYPKKGSLYPLGKGENSAVSADELGVWRIARNVAFDMCTVTVEAHLGLDTEAQRQVFHDLNNLGKNVAASLSFEFDNSNPLNNFIKEELIEGGLLPMKVTDRDITDWKMHDGSIARKDVVAICSILMLNKTNPKSATPIQVAHMEELAKLFWKQVGKIPNIGVRGAKLKTVAAQPVVLKALAKLSYDLTAGRQSNEAQLKELLRGIPSLDFSHKNAMWNFYNLPAKDRASLTGLSEYLPREDGNRDLGSKDEDGNMRFSAKHNDIYPIIGDIVRWNLKLPSRHGSN